MHEASLQVDLYDPDLPNAWKLGLAMEEADETIAAASRSCAPWPPTTLAGWKPASPKPSARSTESRARAGNAEGDKMLKWLKAKTGALLDAGKGVVVLGGDHSTPLGYLHALAERHAEFAILQIDAHCDLRPAYEGFKYSHASIMHNALQLPQVKKLVQVGIRDYCQQEAEFIEQSNGRVALFGQRFLSDEKFAKKSWKKVCGKIIAQLPPEGVHQLRYRRPRPQAVPRHRHARARRPGVRRSYVPAPRHCAGGIKIIGCDLNEVAPGDTEWNGIVGARLLYQLCNWMAVSQGRLTAKGMHAE